MNQPVSNGWHPEVVVEQDVHDDHHADVTAAHRAIVERAQDMLMLVYDIDADNAVELLKWGSRTANVQLPVLARQLLGLATSARADLRSACDDALFAGHEQDHRQPQTGDRP